MKQETLPTLLRDPHISITFNGLMLLVFDKDREHAMFALPKPEEGDPCHRLSITITTFTNGIPQEGKPEYLVKPGEIWLRFPDSSIGVSAFTPDGDQEFLQDFRYLMDLEGEDFHDDKLVPQKRGVHQRLFIERGIFYTAEIGKKLKVKHEKPGSSRPEKVINPCHTLGCDIVLNEGEKAVLDLGSNGNGNNVPRELKYATNIRYKINFSTLCDPSYKQQEDPDFPRYYELVLADEKSDKDRFGVSFDGIVSLGHKACDGCYLSRTTSNKFLEDDDDI